MRIGIDGTLLHRKVTGTERYIRNIFWSLCQLESEHEFALYSRTPLYSSNELPKNAQERSFPSSIDMVTSDFLQDEGCAVDLYHMTWVGTRFADLLPLYLAPASMLTVLDLMLYRNSSYFETDNLHQDYRRRCELAIDLADFVVAISQHTKSDVLANFDIEPDKVKVILLASDSRFGKLNDSRSIERVKKEYGIDKPFLFYLGTDYPHKNHENLLLAFRYLLKERRLSAQLVLAGARRYCKGSAHIERLISELQLGNHLIWLEHITDEELNVLYNAAELFVYPSLDEGFGIPLLEAMACGTPVVASRVASMPEVAGEAAVYFDPADVNDMAAAIERVWSDPGLRQELVELGYRRNREFTWEKTARQTLALYEEAKRIVNGRRDSFATDGYLTKLIDEMLKEYKRLEQDRAKLERSLELRERHLRMLLGTGAIQTYRKARDTIRRITGR